MSVVLDRKIQDAYKQTNAIWSALQRDFDDQAIYYTEKFNKSLDKTAKNKYKSKAMTARIYSEHCWSNIR